MVGHNDASPTSKRNERLSLDSLGCDTRLNGGIADRSGGDMTRYPADFDANVWLPPSPEDEGDDVEARLFGFDYEDDEAGDSGKLLALGNFNTNKIVGVDTITDIAHKEGLRNAVLGHFRALVAQLLKGECIDLENDNGSKSWLEIVSSLAWLAAGYVRPDTKKGGSMDPTDYVKVKCLASGDPSDRYVLSFVV